MNTYLQLFAQLILAVIYFGFAFLLIIETNATLSTVERLSVEILGLDNPSLSAFGNAWRMCLLPFVAIVIDLLMKACFVLVLVTYDNK